MIRSHALSLITLCSPILLQIDSSPFGSSKLDCERIFPGILPRFYRSYGNQALKITLSGLYKKSLSSDLVFLSVSRLWRDPPRKNRKYLKPPPNQFWSFLFFEPKFGFVFAALKFRFLLKIFCSFIGPHKLIWNSLGCGTGSVVGAAASKLGGPEFNSYRHKCFFTKNYSYQSTLKKSIRPIWTAGGHWLSRLK